ncbi:MAG: ATP-binding protein [Thermomicrobiales bacterium]
MAEQLLPSGTVAFLFTDVEGSTKLWQAHGEAMGRAIARHDDLLRAAIESHRGHVFKTVGDAFCAAFNTAPDAVATAIDAQRALGEATWDEVEPIRVRMAVHAGVAEERDADYFGPAVNRVARLLSAGHGGQVLLSLSATELARDALPAGLALRDLGEHRLKDLDRPEHVFDVLIPGLSSEFPPLVTLDARPNNLPLELTPFVGRERETALICEALHRREVRLVTLLGAGGVGKSRLGLQVAAELIDDFPDGAFFVPLAAIREPDLVVPAIAEVLAVRETGGQPLRQALRDRLRSATALLLLDNFEQVAEAAPVLTDLLRECPQLKILVTSRSVLRVSGEHEVVVAPLGLPTAPDGNRITAEVALGSDAVRLFELRARAVKTDFALTDETAPVVVEICRRLDGLPLAIELAAARVRMLTPQAMLPRLDSRLKLLAGGARDRPERQQTLRGAIAWSYDLLPPDQQILLARMSVFAGGGFFETTETVCGGGPSGDPDVGSDGSSLPEVDVFEGISALVEHSLLRQDELDGDARYAMLETVREFGLEQLTAAGEDAELRRRHAGFFLNLAEQAAPELTGASQGHWLRHLDADHDNLRSALAWSLETGMPETALRLGRALTGYWQIRGHLTEGRIWLERAFALDGDVERSLRGRVLNNLGNLANELADYGRARSAYEASLEIWRELGDQLGIAMVLTNLGQLACSQSDFPRAKALLGESLTIWKGLKERNRIASVLHNLGEVAHNEGDFAEAQRLHREALEIRRSLRDATGAAYSASALAHVLHHQGDHQAADELLQRGVMEFREVGDRLGLALALGWLADLAREAGKHDEAARHFAESLKLLREIGAQLSFERLEGVAALARDRDHTERAARLLAAATSIREAVGHPLPPMEQEAQREMVDDLRARLGEAAFAAAWESGQRLPPEEAIEDAIEEATIAA